MSDTYHTFIPVSPAQLATLVLADVEKALLLFRAAGLTGSADGFENVATETAMSYGLSPADVADLRLDAQEAVPEAMIGCTSWLQQQLAERYIECAMLNVILGQWALAGTDHEQIVDDDYERWSLAVDRYRWLWAQVRRRRSDARRADQAREELALTGMTA